MYSGPFLSTFFLVFLAELGDKTQLTAMALAAKHPWKKIFLGIAAAFALLNAGAVLVGEFLFAFLPIFWIKIVSAILFIFFGLTTILARRDEEEEVEGNGKSRRPFVSAFVMILFAEIGDKTQLATASLAAQYDSPLAVFSGSTLALWSVSLLGIFLGAQLSRRVPLHVVHKCAGALFLLFGAIILYQTF